MLLRSDVEARNLNLGLYLQMDTKACTCMRGDDSYPLLCCLRGVKGEMQVHVLIRSTNISSACFVNLFCLFCEWSHFTRSLHHPAKNGSYHIVLLVLKSTDYKSIMKKTQMFPEPISAALGRFLFSCIKHSKYYLHCYDLAHLGHRCLTFLRRQNDCNVLKMNGMILVPPMICSTFEGTEYKKDNQFTFVRSRKTFRSRDRAALWDRMGASTGMESMETSPVITATPCRWCWVAQRMGEVNPPS